MSPDICEGGGIRSGAQKHLHIITDQNYSQTLLEMSHSDSLSILNIISTIHFITVAKSKMYWQGVKSIAFGVKGQS